MAESSRKERRYRRFLEATNAAIWEWDVAADSTEWREGLYHPFGYSPDQPTRFDWWLERIHPEDAQNILTSVRKVIESSDETWSGEYRFRRNDGSYAWVLDRAYIERDKHGKARIMLGAMLDITEGKQVEEALRRKERQFSRLRESNVIGIVSADGERIFEANEAFLKIVGYSQEDVKAGRLRWLSLIVPEQHDAIERSLRELEQTGLMRPHEKEYLRSDGTCVPVMVGGAVSETTPKISAILFVVDLSDLKDLERRLREAQKWETIGVLAGGIAHDFNNLLTTIIGYASTTRDMLEADHPGRGYLARVMESGNAAAQLTTQLLAYSGKGRITLETIDLSTFVRSVEGQIRTAHPPNIELSLELRDDLPAVKADRRYLEQALMTFTANAVEAIGPGLGRISIRTEFQDTAEPPRDRGYLVGNPAPGPYVALEIADTGHGIEPEAVARVFDPFYSTKFLGRGLGLAAVAGIVRKHKGAIQVISAPQRGTTFRILFPAA